MQIALVSSSRTLAQARATVRSADDCIPDCVVHVLDLDGTYVARRDERVVTPEDVGIDAREHHVRTILLEPDDLVRWAQPALLRHALLAGPTVVAVSAGVVLLREPAELADLADRDQVGLIARSAEFLPADGAWPTSADLLAAGSYNPHLVAVGREATRFLDLWERLAADPRTASDSWLDLAASRLPHGTVASASLLVSAWTGPSAQISQTTDGALEVICRMRSIVHRVAGQFRCSGVPFCHERSPEWRVYEQNEVAARRVSPARASRDSLSRYLIPCHTTT